MYALFSSNKKARDPRAVICPYFVLQCKMIFSAWLLRYAPEYQRLRFRVRFSPSLTTGLNIPVPNIQF
jgi:hypothetical protein